MAIFGRADTKKPGYFNKTIYAKFLKEIVTKKRTLGELETITIASECVAILSNLTPMMKDPGSFIIPCSIGRNYVRHALCNLDASVNLMLKFVFMKLDMGRAKPTTVILQLADCSQVQPEGSVEDILVKVDRFVFLVDSIILDCEVDENAHIILGRPFLATGCIVIDCENDKLLHNEKSLIEESIQELCYNNSL